MGKDLAAFFLFRGSWTGSLDRKRSLFSLLHSYCFVSVCQYVCLSVCLSVCAGHRTRALPQHEYSQSTTEKCTRAGDASATWRTDLCCQYFCNQYASLLKCQIRIIPPISNIAKAKKESAGKFVKYRGNLCSVSSLFLHSCTFWGNVGELSSWKVRAQVLFLPGPVFALRERTFYATLRVLYLDTVLYKYICVATPDLTRGAGKADSYE